MMKHCRGFHWNTLCVIVLTVVGDIIKTLLAGNRLAGCWW